MAKGDQPTLWLDDPDGLRLHAVWSRSGSRLGISIFDTAPAQASAQVGLRADQVQELIDFLTGTLATNRHRP